MPTIRVTDYLWRPSKYPAKPICVVFGDDAFLRSSAVRHIRDQVLTTEDAEFSQCLFEGSDKKITFKDVLQELRTVAMFGGGRRIVRIDDADTFVTKCRPELERYAAHPSDQAVLILQLKTFASNTKLYAALAESGLLIEAKTLPEKEMPQWVEQWSKHHYKTVCEPSAAEMIVQRIGAEHGLLDQELSKLSLMVADAKSITPELVEQAGGSWRARTVYYMLDLALEGKTAAAMQQLNALILAGEDPPGIVARIAPSLQKLAMAARLIIDAERRNVRMSVQSALAQVKVERWLLGKAEKQLRHIGRHRGMKLLQWVLQLDLAMKGGSRRSNHRVLLEAFIVKISKVL